MRLFGAILASAALAVAPVLAAAPALAQDNGPLGQVQKFLNGNNNNNNSSDAYQQGRADQQREEQARRDRWRQQHAETSGNYRSDRSSDRYQDPRGAYDPGPRYSQGYSGYNREGDHGN
jgi:hypothetical protein